MYERALSVKPNPPLGSRSNQGSSMLRLLSQQHG
jgi:hypothetical protein